MSRSEPIVLKQFIERYITISSTDWDEIQAYFNRRELEKDEIILQEGEICRQLYFLESGLLCYYIMKDGEERD